jgi:hypothetical protein
MNLVEHDQLAAMGFEVGLRVREFAAVDGRLEIDNINWLWLPSRG